MRLLVSAALLTVLGCAASEFRERVAAAFPLMFHRTRRFRVDTPARGP